MSTGTVQALLFCVCFVASQAHEEPFQIVLRGEPTFCLDLQGGKAANGVPIDIWPCNGLENQLWFFDANSYQIAYAGNDKLCIDAGNMVKGTKLMLWQCNGLPQQKWGYDVNSGKIYLTGAGGCLDLTGADTHWGNQLEVWDCNGLKNQQWNLMAGITIRMRNSVNTCLDLYGGKTDNGNKIQAWYCNGLQNQLWFFDPGSYQIQYAGDRKKCIDAGNMQGGTQLKLWDCNGLNQQKFGYDYKAGTVFLMASANSANATSTDRLEVGYSQCMDLAGGSFNNGDPIQIWACNGCWNQQFQVIGPASQEKTDSASYDVNGGCPPVPAPPPPPAPPSPKPAAGKFYPHCTEKNQYGWPTFKDYNSLAKDPWGCYFKEVYGWVPTSGYPICIFDFWYLHVSKVSKCKAKTPSAMVARHNGQIGSWFNTMWSLQPPDASWILHKTVPNGGLVDNTWIEGTHHQVGTPAGGDEIHGAWFVPAHGANLWFNLGKTKVFPSHGAAASFFCGHSANDPQTAACAVAKGYDSYQFVYNGLTDLNEVVLAKRNGGYICTQADTKTAFRAGWEAALPCVCNQAIQTKVSNCDPTKHMSNRSEFLQNPSPDASPAYYLYGKPNVSIVV